MIGEINWTPEIAAIVMTMAIPIVGIIAYYWHVAATKASQNELKRQMVERGMSADEIERVLRAGGKGEE